MPEHTPDPPRWHIVATDDDPKLLAKVTYALRDAGHVVYAAYNGYTACQLAVSTPKLDLLITNTRVQGLGVLEIIRRVREQRPGLPILHIGEPLPPGELWDNVPTLSEPVTSEDMCEAVEGLLRR